MMLKRSKSDETKNNKIDTSIVARRSLLSSIRGCYSESIDFSSWHEAAAQQCSYPRASIYYACNADADPSRRGGVTDFIGNCNIAPPRFGPPTNDDPYSEEEARIKYLSAKPVCYIVLGKPGLDTELLAELIAEERNCVLISVTKILRELDLDKKDDEDCGCVSREAEVWNRIVSEVYKRSVCHRGYVLDGLPLLQSKEKSSPRNSASFENSEASLKSSHAVKQQGDFIVVEVRDCVAFTANLRKPCDSEKSIGSTDSHVSSSSIDSNQSTCLSNVNTESLNLSSSEPSVQSSETCLCSEESKSLNQCSEYSVFFQLHDIFNNWHLKPDVIVNVTCPNDEILAKYKSGSSCSASSVENVDCQSNSSTVISSKISKFSSESAFIETLECQLCMYEKEAKNVIEKFIVTHNPQNVIRIDGRYPIDHIFETVKIRLQVLPLRPTIIPERMILEENHFKDSLDASSESEWLGYENESFENTDEDNNLNLKRSFDELRRNGVPSDKFQWQLSRWKFLCPVELARGKKIEGKKKFAVRFMRWIFFLSSNEAVQVFIENPRSYLLPPNPRPCCRIAVIGPRFAGKTKLSFDLAKELDSVVLDVREVIRRFNRDFDEVSDDNSSRESVNLRIVEIVNAVAEIIENLPEQNCGCFTRNRGWILDDLSLDYNTCKTFLENDINIDTAVILFESDPFQNLIKKWNKMQEENSDMNEYENLYESEMSHEEILSHFEEAPIDSRLIDYIKELESFENSRNYVASKLADLGIDVIFCDLKFISDPLTHVISEIRKEYDYVPEILEENEGDEGEEEYESDSNLSIQKDHENNYPTGDCDVYCPVSLINNGVLWKGKMEYKCLLAEKLYFMSSQAALDDFMINYPKLNVPFKKPFTRIPSLRVFIVGPPGSGKSTLANLISREIGLAYVDFFKSFDLYMSNRGIDVQSLTSLLTVDNFEDDSSSNNSFEEIQLPENLDDQMYNLDKSTIVNFFLKYKKEGAQLPSFIAKECIANFFKPPFSECGLLVDSFPNCLEDCETMLKYSAIPDLVIELRCDFADSEKRLLQNLVRQWRAKRDEKNADEERKYLHDMDDYLNKKESWVRKEIFKRYQEKKFGSTQDIKSDSEDLSNPGSLLNITDWSSVLSTEDEIEIEEKYYELFPQPEHSNKWDDESSVKEKFCLQIEENYDRTMHNLSIISSFFENETIPWIQVDARQNIQQVFIQILHILSPYNSRNSSFFEQVQEIDNLTAEYLLSTGFYFLSSFGRFCPVQLYNRRNLFQMFVPLASRDQIFAVTHRQFIYFLAGETALADFKRHPLNYLNQDHQVPMIPTKISIIGPPKCGKTTLSKRFASTYDFELISRDEVIDYALTHFQTSNLSMNMKSRLQNGETVTPEQIASSVKLMLSNPQCVTQGCVFDGFPANVEESQAFLALAINPIIIIDLEASLDFTLQCFEDDDNYNYLSKSHCHSYEDWNTDARILRKWLSHNFGNIVKIDATKSKAYVWKRANENVQQRFASLVTYIREVDYDKVHDLQYLCITPWEIERMISPFKLYCPSCIYFHGIYKNVDLAKSRTGLVQYREYFYWFCNKHIELFRRNPNESLQLFDNIKLPEHYPQIISDIVDLDNRCWLTKLVNKGYCLISYVENLPNRKLVPGNPSLAVLYKHQLYLFCSESCREKFTQKFLNYSIVQIHFPEKLPSIDVKALPSIGYLEQTVAALLAKAVTHVAQRRPKLLDLSPSASAAVFIGTFLKAYGGCPLEVNLYKKALDKMERRCEISKLAIENMKRRINPWLNMHKNERKAVKIHKAEKLKESKFNRMTATVKFKKASLSQIIILSGDSTD